MLVMSAAEQKYWQLSRAHLLTQPACLCQPACIASLLALFAPDTNTHVLLRGFCKLISLGQSPHRYLRKVDCSSFVICLIQTLPLSRAFLWRPLTELTGQAKQAVCAINQSIL
jgi:hypothetical protein